MPRVLANETSEVAVAHLEAVAAPEDILALETALVSLYIRSLLERRLPRMNGHALQKEVVPAIKGAFTPEFLVNYLLHKNERILRRYSISHNRQNPARGTGLLYCRQSINFARTKILISMSSNKTMMPI